MGDTVNSEYRIIRKSYNKLVYKLQKRCYILGIPYWKTIRKSPYPDLLEAYLLKLINNEDYDYLAHFDAEGNRVNRHESETE
jgi:hypothetical protein